jgi:hypothetical protein
VPAPPAPPPTPPHVLPRCGQCPTCERQALWWSAAVVAAAAATAAAAAAAATGWSAAGEHASGGAVAPLHCALRRVSLSPARLGLWLRPGLI